MRFRAHFFLSRDCGAAALTPSLRRASVRKGIMDKLEIMGLVRKSNSKTVMANAFRRALGIEEYPVKPRRRKRVKG